MITIQNLHKSFSRQTVLKSVFMELHPGNIYGFVGKNGAGKTTFFNCLAGLEQHEGDIQYSNGLLKNSLGYLPTEPYFFSKITGSEYLELMCIARNIKLNMSGNTIKLFDLPLKKYAEHYSTGMKKKLAILGVLLQQNEVFLFDEPFNGLDIQSNMELSEIILHLKEENKIILLSSHILSTLEELSDEIFLLENGSFHHFKNKEEFKGIKPMMSSSNKSNISEMISKI